jgi:hypothetical protein
VTVRAWPFFGFLFPDCVRLFGARNDRKLAGIRSTDRQRRAMISRLPSLFRSRHAVHRATKYPIGRLLGGSLILISASPDAGARTIAPGAPGLKLRDASVVTFHVAIGAFDQTSRKPASLAL